MPEEILTIVKIPLSEIAESLRNKHDLPSKITDARIEGDTLILTFAPGDEVPETVVLSNQVSPSRSVGRKRRRAKRNRMKTRGWAVVDRITNSKGQQCTIYKPFVDALQNRELTKAEQRKKVESILKANRNRPSDESVNYFLDNTLEYLNLSSLKTTKEEVST
jgi:hypothetical protein